jgi:hypothetical protein
MEPSTLYYMLLTLKEQTTKRIQIRLILNNLNYKHVGSLFLVIYSHIPSSGTLTFDLGSLKH